MAYVLIAQEIGGFAELEERLDELEKKTPEGIRKMQENWGRTPEAKAAMAAAESQFGIRQG